jgi:hypothetical protein
MVEVSMLSMYRAQLARERKAADKSRKAVADASQKISRKQGELGRTKSDSRKASLSRDIVRLEGTRQKAEAAVAKHEAKSTDLQAKVDREVQREQDKAATAAASRDRLVDRRLASTSSEVERLSDRVEGLEEGLLSDVSDAVQADPVARAHDVFLSHTGESEDVEVSAALRDELVARGLDVWFDGAELQLGVSLMRQIDRGIAKARCGVVLVTPALLAGRTWTEREIGALVSSGRRVIPVLDGVTYEELAGYSPILVDLVGLETETLGLAGIAESVAKALQPPQLPS